VPADCRIISGYDNPNGYSEYLAELEAQRGDTVVEDDDDAEQGEKHGSGYALLAIDQSAMTGESLAVDKYVADAVYYTTGCKRGKAYAIVTHSAKMSFVGRTASLVTGAKDQGHFKAIMNSIGTALLVLVVFFILISWIGGFFHHLPIATPMKSSVNLLHYALILLIVGVPVGLPVVTTTTLAVGAAYLAKEKAIVQKLTAIESLAVSCSLIFHLPYSHLKSGPCESIAVHRARTCIAEPLYPTRPLNWSRVIGPSSR
jgi:H+-transporting ATPase